MRRDVGDRGEVDVDAEARERGTGGRALRTGGARPAVGAHLRRRERRRRPRDPLDRAAFLVDGDQERQLAAGGRGVAELLREGAQRGRRRDVPAEQDHAADLAAPDPAEQAGARGRRAVHRHDQALTDELGEVRGGRGAGDRRRPGRGREGGGRGRLGGRGRPVARRRRGPGPAASAAGMQPATRTTATSAETATERVVRLNSPTTAASGSCRAGPDRCTAGRSRRCSTRRRDDRRDPVDVEGDADRCDRGRAAVVRDSTRVVTEPPAGIVTVARPDAGDPCMSSVPLPSTRRGRATAVVVQGAEPGVGEHDGGDPTPRGAFPGRDAGGQCRTGAGGDFGAARRRRRRRWCDGRGRFRCRRSGDRDRNGRRRRRRRRREAAGPRLARSVAEHRERRDERDDEDRGAREADPGAGDAGGRRVRRRAGRRGGSGHGRPLVEDLVGSSRLHHAPSKLGSGAAHGRPERPGRGAQDAGRLLVRDALDCRHHERAPLDRRERRPSRPRRPASGRGRRRSATPAAAGARGGGEADGTGPSRAGGS